MKASFRCAPIARRTARTACKAAAPAPPAATCSIRACRPKQKLHAKLTMNLRRGQMFRHELPGAGGWGDPLERDLALVAQDLRDGLVTIEGAARDYGVVAHGDPPEIDPEATKALRLTRRPTLRRSATRAPLP